MSYSCYISFKKMEAIEIIPFLRQYKTETIAKLKDIAEENCGYLPYFRSASVLIENFSDVSLEEREKAKNWAKTCVFQYKYFYHEKLKLLGIFGIPTCMRHLFDQTVCFQNSCDQDYEREIWQGISDFENVYDDWFSKSDDDIKKHFFLKYGYEFDKEHSCENLKEKIDYYRRDFAYETIWGNFENYLYDEEESIFFSIFGNYNSKELLIFIKSCHETYIEDWKKFEAELNKKNSIIQSST